MNEKIARYLCSRHGRDPDSLEPGDVYGVDGTCANGDPGHFSWREFLSDAKEIVSEVRKALR